MITAGRGGFGGPLVIQPNDSKNKIVNITGGVISAVAEKIADMTDCVLVDGFKTRVPDHEQRCST